MHTFPARAVYLPTWITGREAQPQPAVTENSCPVCTPSRWWAPPLQPWQTPAALTCCFCRSAAEGPGQALGLLQLDSPEQKSGPEGLGFCSHGNTGLLAWPAKGRPKSLESFTLFLANRHLLRLCQQSSLGWRQALSWPHAKPGSGRAGGARALASRPVLIGHLHCQEENGYARVWWCLVVAGKASSAGEQNQDYRAKHASGYWRLKFLSWKSENITFETGQRQNIVQKGYLKEILLN